MKKKLAKIHQILIILIISKILSSYIVHCFGELCCNFKLNKKIAKLFTIIALIHISNPSNLIHHHNETFP